MESEYNRKLLIAAKEKKAAAYQIYYEENKSAEDIRIKKLADDEKERLEKKRKQDEIDRKKRIRDIWKKSIKKILVKLREFQNIKKRDRVDIQFPGFRFQVFITYFFYHIIYNFILGPFISLFYISSVDSFNLRFSWNKKQVKQKKKSIMNYNFKGAISKYSAIQSRKEKQKPKSKTYVQVKQPKLRTKKPAKTYIQSAESQPEDKNIFPHKGIKTVPILENIEDQEKEQSRSEVIKNLKEDPKEQQNSKKQSKLNVSSRKSKAQLQKEKEEKDDGKVKGPVNFIYYLWNTLQWILGVSIIVQLIGQYIFGWKNDVYDLKLFFGPFFDMIYMALIHSVIYATMNDKQLKELQERKMNDIELRKLGLDLQLSQDADYSITEFIHTIQANDLDIMIQWIKFFMLPGPKQKYRMYLEICKDDEKNRIKGDMEEIFMSNNIQLARSKKRNKMQHKHKLNWIEVTDDDIKCSVKQKKSKDPEKELPPLKHSEIKKGTFVYGCLKHRTPDKLCNFYACENCYMKYDFFRDLESRLLINIIKKGQICQQDQIDYKEYEEILTSSRKILHNYQQLKYIHISQLTKFLIMSQAQENKKANKYIDIFVTVRVIVDIINVVQTHQYGFQMSQLPQYILLFFLYLNSLICTKYIYKYLQNGIYALDIRKNCLMQISSMISMKNQEYSWQKKQSVLPKIDFMDSLTISSYGKLRNFLLEFGHRYMARIQIVFTSILLIIFLQLIWLFLIYAQRDLEGRAQIISSLSENIIPFYMAPLLFFIAKMLFSTAEINQYFNIQRILLQKLSFLIKELQVLPYKYYFNRDKTKENVVPHNQVLEEIIERLLRKHQPKGIKKKDRDILRQQEEQRAEEEKEKEKQRKLEELKKLKEEAQSQGYALSQPKKTKSRIKKTLKPKTILNQSILSVNTSGPDLLEVNIPDVKKQVSYKEDDLKKHQQRRKKRKKTQEEEIEKEIQKDLKNLLKVYDSQLSELMYDEVHNLQKIIGIPVTMSLLTQLGSAIGVGLGPVLQAQIQTLFAKLSGN